MCYISIIYDCLQSRTMNTPFSEKASIMLLTSTEEGKYVLEALKAQPEYFRDKNILNVGAGVVDLERILLEKGVDANVTNLDLNYNPRRKSVLWNLVLKATRKQYPPHSIQADMTEMPFEDQSFDISISTSSLLDWVEADRAVVAFKEICRVTKHEVLVAPYSPNNNQNLVNLLSSNVGENFNISTPDNTMIKLTRKIK